MNFRAFVHDKYPCVHVHLESTRKTTRLRTGTKRVHEVEDRPKCPFK